MEIIKIQSLSNFEAYNTVLLATSRMQWIKSSGLRTYQLGFELIPLNNISPISPAPALGNHHLTQFLQVWFPFDFTCKWHHSVFFFHLLFMPEKYTTINQGFRVSLLPVKHNLHILSTILPLRSLFPKSHVYWTVITYDSFVTNIKKKYYLWTGQHYASQTMKR